ncbi:MAG: phosphoribosylaminoimidazolesuccinocarboxamide synthase [Nitrospirota bacterium]
MSSEIVIETDFDRLVPFSRGKVRDIYDFGDKLLIVATDRISAFDFILPDGIPDKGKVLTQLSIYWFRTIGGIIPVHFISGDIEDYPDECKGYSDILKERSMLVKKTEPLPVEAVVRGYISGSAWNEYQETGSVCGIKLPAGLLESSRLDNPIFTPSTKAESGNHDENISLRDVQDLIGKEMAERIRDVSISIYRTAQDIAEKKGIIIADTKFEFGIYNGKLMLIDEVLTPDSSRFWPEAEYKPGRAQNSFDKQFVRDYLLSINWNKRPPVPDLPEDIIQKTSSKYKEALERIAGLKEGS